MHFIKYTLVIRWIASDDTFVSHSYGLQCEKWFQRCKHRYIIFQFFFFVEWISHARSFHSSFRKPFPFICIRFLFLSARAWETERARLSCGPVNAGHDCFIYEHDNKRSKRYECSFWIECVKRFVRKILFICCRFILSWTIKIDVNGEW